MIVLGPDLVLASFPSSLVVLFLHFDKEIQLVCLLHVERCHHRRRVGHVCVRVCNQKINESHYPPASALAIVRVFRSRVKGQVVGSVAYS